MIFYSSVLWLWESGFYVVSDCTCSVKINSSLKCIYNLIVHRCDSVSLRSLASRFRLRGKDDCIISVISTYCTIFFRSNSNSLSHQSEFIVCSAKLASCFPWQEGRENLNKLLLCLKTNCNMVTPQK